LHPIPAGGSGVHHDDTKNTKVFFFAFVVLFVSLWFVVFVFISVPPVVPLLSDDD
jgi:hypothetical protein